MFDLFNYPLLVGDPKTALTKPGSIVLSQALAKKYFGDADPMGQMMKWDNSLDMQVTGILGEIPRDSHITFEGLASFSTIRLFWKDIETRNWVWNPCWTYVRLKEGVSKAEVDRIFPDFIQKYYPDFVRVGAHDRNAHRELPRDTGRSNGSGPGAPARVKTSWIQMSVFMACRVPRSAPCSRGRQRHAPRSAPPQPRSSGG